MTKVKWGLRYKNFAVIQTALYSMAELDAQMCLQLSNARYKRGAVK